MVEDGQRVVVHLVITLVDDETVVETTDSNVATAGTDDQHRDRPHEFVGEGDVARAVEDAVRGLEPGETRRVTVEPGSASPSGPWREEAVVGLARDLLNARNDAGGEPGTLVLSTRGVDGWTTVTGEELVSVDFDHGLVGERLVFEVGLLEVRDGETDPE